MSAFGLRDVALDLDLESGAHLILILVAMGLALLLLATVVTLYLFPVCRIMRRTLFSRKEVQNPEVS